MKIFFHLEHKSYSIGQVILGKGNEPNIEIVNGAPKKCCQDQYNCPLMPDRCDLKSVIYQADVYPEDTVMTYYSLTENEFKSRCSKQVNTSHPSETKTETKQVNPHTFGN